MSDLQADRRLALLHKRILFSPWIQPINADIEKAKLMKDRLYDPILRYRKPLNNFDLIKKELQDMKTEPTIIGHLLKQKKKELINLVDLIKSVGTREFTHRAILQYGKPDVDLVRKARVLLNLETETHSVHYDSVSTIKKFLDVLLRHGFNWQVKKADIVVGASFNVTRKTIYINKNKLFSENDIKRLIVHEIGTHITRAENGKNQHYKLFYVGFPNYLITEEGLAVYNEEKAGLLTNNILKTYAGRVIAVDLALKNSFSTTYNSLLEFFSKEEAWILTLRAKRGLIDTSKAGACPKDYLYLAGLYKVKEFVRKGGSIKDLYIGKIGTEHVPLLKYFKNR